MIQVIKSAERHLADFGWLQTRWHFSFSDYYDPANVHWGALRVFNDDIVQPAGGFGRHGHRDMEIVTLVLDGALEHQDSLGHRQQLRPGEVQVMSAGKGILHSEYNALADRPSHFLQLWILPRTIGSTPRYEQRAFEPAERRNRLQAVASGQGADGALWIDQDATVHLASLAADQAVEHPTAPERRPYLFVIDGAVRLNGTPLGKGDQARIAGEAKLQIVGDGDSEIILVDVPDAGEID